MIGKGLRSGISFSLRRGTWGYHYDSVDIAGEDFFVVEDGWRMTWDREVYVLQDTNRSVEVKSIHLMTYFLSMSEFTFCKRYGFKRGK
jgi:hypothetical protein